MEHEQKGLVIKMDFLIGVDAGGTKTVAQSFSLEGEPLLSFSSGAGNLTLSFENGIENIKLAIDGVLKQHADSVCKYICIGCAGVETGNLKARALSTIMLEFGSIVFVTNDAMLALYSALKGEDGVLVISGTGAIGYLKSEGELIRSGGWGHLINDDGSGYSIGSKAIRHITDSADNGINDTPLRRAIFEKLNISQLNELIDFTYKADKCAIASLAPVVEMVANEGDETAMEILTWAGKALAKLVITLCSRKKISNPKIAISGSVIKKTLLLKLAFIEKLDRCLDDYLLIDEQFDPAKAVFYLYNQYKNKNQI